jgi:molybdopterin-guanine dinucleotide biosynthesis protein A
MFRRAAAIIAGGAARRFGGRDKSRLVIAGETIIDRQARALQPLTDDVFLVASQRERFAGLPWPVVPDRYPGTGVLGAIATALSATDAPLVLTIACDLPFLTTPLLAALFERAAEPGADAAWICTAAGPEPLIACYRRSALPIIESAIGEGRLTAGKLGEFLDVRSLDEAALRPFGDPARLTANINRAEELRMWNVESGDV